MDKDRYEYLLENHPPLRFGTTGLRDEDSKLTDMQIYLSTKGFLNYLIAHNLTEKGTEFALAGDFRPSTPRILFAVAFAAIESGFQIDYLGNVPSPTLALWGFSKEVPSAMVTASHNPYGQNGVKFIEPEHQIMKEEEKDVLEEISKVREKEYRLSWEESMFDKEGLFKNTSYLSEERKKIYYDSLRVFEKIDDSAKKFYIDRYTNTFGRPLNEVRVVFYEQTSVGRDLIPEILERLGAEVIRVGRVDEKKEFIPVDTEDMKPWILEKMAFFAFLHNCDICISADGDADRPAIVYLVKDEKGKQILKNGKPFYKFVIGDILNVIVSLFIKPDYVVVPIHITHKSGFIVLKDNNIKVKLTKIGEPPVVKAMKEIIEKDRTARVYGFERNGGVIFVTDFNIPEIGIIGPLGERDALFPILCLLLFAKKKNKSVQGLIESIFTKENFSHVQSSLVENLPGISITPGLERYNHEVGKKIVDRLKPLHEKIYEIDFENAEICFLDDKKEIVVEKVVEHLINIRNVLHPYVKNMLGLKGTIKIKKINFLDGVKIYLSHGEVVHLRPSGNSAQFRIYIESPDEERAVELVERAVKGPDGALVKFINDFIDGKINL
jgi:phosphomannomutase